MTWRLFVVCWTGAAITATCGLFPGAASAAEPLGAYGTSEPAQALSLQDAFLMGLQNSRAVHRARYQPLQAEEDYQKAKSIYDPSIFMVSTSERTDRPTQSLLDGVPVESALREDRWQVQAGIKDRMPTGGTLSLYQEGGRLASNSSYVFPDPQYQSRIVASLTQPLLKGLGDQEGATSIEVAGLNRQIAESAFKRDVIDILMEIANNYWQLYFEQNVARVSRESLARAEDVYRRERTRAEQGLSKPVDVDRALVAMKSRKSTLLRANNQVQLTMRQLWLTLAPERMFSPSDIPQVEIKDQPQLGAFPWPRRELLAGALNQRQELAIARDTVEVNQRQQSLAQHNQLPILDLKLTYGFNALDASQDGLASDPYDTEYSNWRVELAFEWPLGGRSASAEKRKADYRLLQSKTDMRLAAERISLELDIVLDELRLAEEELNATREAMEAARRVMAGEEVLFELGQKDNQDLLTVQDYFGASEKEYLRALSRYNLNLVNLARARGSLLGDYGLKADFVTAQNPE